MAATVYESTANLPVGSRILNLNSINYTVEGDFSPVYATREIRRNDVNGDASDFQIRAEPATLTVTLQVPNSSVTRPLLGTIANINSVNWVAVTVTPHERQGDLGTFEVTLRSATTPTN